MFKWTNKFSQETLWDGRYLYQYDYGIDEVIKVNNIYYAKLEYETIDVMIRLTKKEDKITKMQCNCNSRKRNCKHLAAVLYYIENEEIPEITFKHNSNTKYPRLTVKQFEKYLEKDIEDIDAEQLREFTVNILLDYEDLFKNYVLSFKKTLSTKDEEILLKQLNNILKLDIGVTEATDKFLDKIIKFLDEDMINYQCYENLSIKIYLKIYEKIISTKYLLDTFEYTQILIDLNANILDNLQNGSSENKEYVKDELDRFLKEYPDTLFANELLYLLQNVSEKNEVSSNIKIIRKQIEKEEDPSLKEDLLRQLLVSLEENDYEDEKIIEILENYVDEFYTIKLLQPYYLKTGKTCKAIASLEHYLKKTGKYDDNRYDAIIELKNLQFKLNNLDNYKLLILKLITEYAYYDEDDFKNLKENDPEWESMKKDIIKLYNYQHSNLLNFYLYNDMIKEFEDEIFKYPDMKEILEYEEILIEKSPQRLEKEYENMIYDLLTVAKSSKYRKVVKILNQMKNMPNSEDNIQRIISDLKEKYPKRKSLMTELRKV